MIVLFPIIPCVGDNNFIDVQIPAFAGMTDNGGRTQVPPLAGR